MMKTSILNCDPKEFIWSQKYRPKTIETTILPKSLENLFASIINNGQLQNYIFSGPPGIGKTTVAKAICDQLKIEYLFINASNQRNIDLIRETLFDFVSTTSLFNSNPLKVVILDEGDNLNAESSQPALRSFIEEHSKNCRFIVTANYPNKLIEPLQSRFTVVDFLPTEFTKREVLIRGYRYVCSVLSAENVTYSDETIGKVLVKYAPDWRTILNKLQANANANSNKIENNILYGLKNEKIAELFSILKKKNYRELHSWVITNAVLGSATIFSEIFNSLETYVAPGTGLAEAVHILGQYQYTASFVPDKVLNLVACFADMMISPTISYL